MNITRPLLALIITLFAASLAAPIAVAGGECANPRSEWIFCEDFQDEDWAEKWGEVSHTSLKTRDTTRSAVGSASLRQTFNPGTTGAGWMHYWWTPQPDQEEVYLRYYVYYQDGFDWGTGDVKMNGLRAMLPDVTYPPGAGQVPDGTYFNTRAVSVSYEHGGEPPQQPFLYAYHPEQAGSWGDFLHQNQDTRIQLETGRWYCIELMIRPNTPGSSDGTQKLWIDDVLVAEHTNMYLRDSEDVQIKNLFQSAWQGEATHSSPQYRWDDGLVVSTSQVGCTGSTPENDAGDDSTERPGDVTGDGTVGIDDLLVVVDNIGRTAQDPDFDARADVTGTGEVNIFDLVFVARHFGADYTDDDSETLAPPELTVSQVSGEEAVFVHVTCPEVADWCQARRTSPGGHVVLIDGSSHEATATDGDVVSGTTYAYDARYWRNGEVSETAVSQVTVQDVSEPSDPPETGFRPNEPDGFEPIGFVDFSESLEADGWNVRSSSRVTHETDAQAPVACCDVAQKDYLVGDTGGGGVAMVHNIPDHAPEALYGSVWIKISENFRQHSSGITKIFYAWSAGNPKMILSTRGNDLRLDSLLRHAPGATGYLAPNVVSGARLERGQWHLVEYLVESPSEPGVADGSKRWWIDGELVGEYTGLDIHYEGQSLDWHQFEWNTIWGGTGDEVTAEDGDMYWRAAHLYVSGKTRSHSTARNTGD